MAAFAFQPSRSVSRAAVRQRPKPSSRHCPDSITMPRQHFQKTKKMLTQDTQPLNSSTLAGAPIGQPQQPGHQDRHSRTPSVVAGGPCALLPHPSHAPHGPANASVNALATSRPSSRSSGGGCRP
uniref:Uncharacterized protein n=1 Tax=Chlamydomonas euryale TaxID=1486919 RepID=A0A7R9VJM5_9CHLO